MKLDSKYGGVFFKNCIQRSLSLFLSLLMSTYAFAQTNFKTDSTGIVADTITNDTIYSFAEVMPEYPGGDHALQVFFLNNIHWPDVLDNGDEIPSTFYLSWVVEKDGSVTDPEVEIQSGMPLSKELEQTIINAISKLPDFIPAKMNGTSVRFQFRIPLRICLRG